MTVGEGMGVDGKAAVCMTVAEGVGNSVVGKLQAKMASNKTKKAQSRKNGWRVIILNGSLREKDGARAESYHDLENRKPLRFQLVISPELFMDP